MHEVSAGHHPPRIAAGDGYRQRRPDRPGRGFLVVLKDTSDAPAFNPSSTRAMLYIRLSDLDTYALGLKWLQHQNLFTAVLYEDDEPTPA
ncbi:MAG TPA: hypothetical protein VGH86_09470 [Phenylobacterium sp.]